jgi:hypothetical protein
MVSILWIRCRFDKLKSGCFFSILGVDCWLRRLLRLMIPLYNDNRRILCSGADFELVSLLVVRVTAAFVENLVLTVLRFSKPSEIADRFGIVVHKGRNQV